MIHGTGLHSLLVASLLSGIALTACGADDGGPNTAGENDDETGGLTLRLSTVPSDASCLKVTVEGNRSVTKSFPLSAGQSASFFLDRLPVGAVKVDARGYAEACNKLESTSVPSWVTAEKQVARIDALEVASILLKLIRNGRADVSVDFEAPPWMSTVAEPVEIAVIGDTPYGAAQIEDLPNLLGAIGDSGVRSAVHVGDIKNGSSRCDDSYFAQILTGFASMPIPLIYTPGDNEWTDCHRANNGAYDPLERLAAVRDVFYPVPGLALGDGWKQVFSQSEVAGFEKFVENQIWYEASVAFGAVHVVGSNDSTPAWYTDDATGTKVDDPARRNAERSERNAATLAWLEQLFQIADENSAKGVVIFQQADMFDAFSVANNVPLDAFNNIVQRIATLSKAFNKPVLLIEGDSHFFIADKPLENGSAIHGVSDKVPNLTRIVVQGSTTTPKTEWLRLRVDPASPSVFSWTRNAR